MSEYAYPHITALEDRLAQGEVGFPVRCAVGFEIDYRLQPVELAGRSDQVLEDHFGRDVATLQRNRATLQTSIRRQAHNEVAALVPSNDLQERKRQRWLDQIDDLTPAELVMFAVHQQLSRPTLERDVFSIENVLRPDQNPRATIAYRFGQQLYQDGYYDNPNAPECRTMPAGPTVALARRQRVIDTLRTQAHFYGMDVAFSSGHTNMSFWRPTAEGFEPLHDLSTPEGLEMSSRIGAGMLLALRDATPAYMSRDTPSRKAGLQQYTLGHNRTTTIRITPDRFEARIGYGDREQTDRKVAAMIGGFIHGLETDYAVPIQRAPGFGPAPHFDKVRDIHVLRTIEHSAIADDGALTLNPGFAYQRGDAILQALTGYRVTHPNPDAFVHARKLVEAIQFTHATLRCDTEALATMQGYLSSAEQARLEAAGAQLSPDYMNNRLSTVAYTGMRHEITACVADDYLAPGRIGVLMQRYFESPILRHVIPEALRRQDVVERTQWYR